MRSVSVHRRNFLFYLALAAAFTALTWIYGWRILYISVYAVALLPALSFCYAFAMLRFIRVKQICAKRYVVKNEWNKYTVAVKNVSPFVYESVRFIFLEDKIAVETDDASDSFFAKPFMSGEFAVNFFARYRGEFNLGLQAIEVRDPLGVFLLRRKVKGSFTLAVLPLVIEIPRFSFAALLSQAHSNYEIKDEDYSSVSDVRNYLPEDSIKRIHWKLSAKRNELLVKNFQSNALNSVSLILNTGRPELSYEESLRLEDRVVENAVSAIHYCLRRRMPVSLFTADNLKTVGRSFGDFEALYHIAARVRFTAGAQEDKSLALLDQCLNESTSYLNIVIATASFGPEFFERVVNAGNAGHFVAVLYFPPDAPERESEEIFEQLSQIGVSAQRIASGPDE